VAERLAVYQQAADDPSRYIAEMAKLEAKKLERGRAWIENGPLQPTA
jgi:hypothetical protein